ncbi:hypothetical protein ACFVFH_34705 [Streptomyces sp. NPDC057697]|uniref:hypothetical protein n=1 Tax=Streptomyces sp. NPDC057697 TaxID=3346219 RepID=UPI0036A798F3
MSNSAAAAVLTTDGLPEALHAVRTLPRVADTDHIEVGFEVHVRNRNGDQTARVHWLADRVGGRFTGRVELAPL